MVNDEIRNMKMNDAVTRRMNQLMEIELPHKAKKKKKKKKKRQGKKEKREKKEGKWNKGKRKKVGR